MSEASENTKASGKAGNGTSATSFLYRKSKRIVIFVVGTTVVLFGAIMLLIPGPGLVTIAVGLGILSAEFVWARRLLHKVKRGAGDAVEGVQNRWGSRSKSSNS